MFDQRVGVDPALQETDAAQCFSCLSPLTAAEQQDPRYVPGRSCPWCYRTDAEQRAEVLRERNRAIRAATEPLPGSLPVETFRPLRVPQQCEGLTVVETFSRLISHLPEDYWQEECRRGNLLDSRHQVPGSAHRVRAGERLLHRLPFMAEPPVNGEVRVLYEDEALIVLHKPAPLPMHAGGRYTRNTLQQILNTVYRPQKPRPAHRLDANTTGVVVVARSRHFAGRLQGQFADGRVTKSYLVRVHGHPAAGHFQCEAPITRTAGAAGTRAVDATDGLQALTTFNVMQRFADGTSLLEALPVTGRTNQIRIHCAFLGFPVVGDAAYSGMADGPRQTLDPDDPPLCLHAWRISFAHPVSGETMSFTAPPPPWAA